MPHISANGIELFYEEHGNPEHEPMLLVMGLGAQMTLWPDEFIDALVAKSDCRTRWKEQSRPSWCGR